MCAERGIDSYVGRGRAMNPPVTSASAEYRQIKSAIDRAYPAGWFVAVANGQVVGAEAEFWTLENALRARSIDPCTTLVIQSGVDYPENVEIFI